MLKLAGAVAGGAVLGTAACSAEDLHSSTAASNSGPSATRVQPVGNPSGGPWILAFNDDFDVPYPTPYGTGPYPAVWSDRYVYGTGFRVNASTATSWDAHGYYGHLVANSILTLTARFEDPTTIDPACTNPMINGVKGYFTTGGAFSFPGFNFTQGYVEARISNPPVSVSGNPTDVWPVFWHLEFTQWPPEIDTEEFNIGGPSDIHVGFKDLGGVWHDTYLSGDSGVWHVYGMRLDPSYVTFFKDGQQVFQAGSGNIQLPWHVILEHVTTGNSPTGWPGARPGTRTRLTTCGSGCRRRLPASR